MLGFAALTPTYLEHAARMRFGCDRSDFFRDDYLGRQGGEPGCSCRDARAFSLLFLSEIGDQLDGLRLREFGCESI